MRVNVSTLAGELGRSDRQTLRLLDQLRAAGLLHTQRTGRSLIFRLIHPSRQLETI
jgi:DNA-binding IscR family transcriptional regulator